MASKPPPAEKRAWENDYSRPPACGKDRLDSPEQFHENSGDVTNVNMGLMKEFADGPIDDCR